MKPLDRTRTGLRLLLAALCLTVAAGLALTPTGTTGATSAGDLIRVSHAVLSCPAALTGARQVSAASAIVAQPVALGAGAAWLQTLSAPTPLATVTAADAPATVAARGGQQVPLVVTGQGGWAAALAAGIAGRVATGRGTGLYSAQCLPVRSQWWFVGAGSTLGRSDVLAVANPTSEPARFDVDMLGRDGPVSAVAGRGLEVAGNSQVTLRLDALAPGEDLLAVTVRATAGQISASLATVAAPVSDQPRGGDYLPAAATPDTNVVIAGIPAGKGRRSLVLANPGTQFATAQVSALTSAGPGELPDLLTAAVPAQSVVSIDLGTALAGRSATLQLTSDQPITGAVSASYGEGTRELMWLSATPLVGDPALLAAAPAVPAGAGLAAKVTVAAPGEAVFGTLTILAYGDGETSRFRPGSDIANSTRTWKAMDPQAPRVTSLRINVPAGSQRQLTLPAEATSELLDLYWTADPGSAPAAVSHVVTASGNQPMATGMQWWPTTSLVPSVATSPDISVLVPAPASPAAAG